MVFVDLWEKELIRQGKSKNTVENYIRDIRKFIIWFKDSYSQDFNGKILELDIKQYQSYLLNIKKQNINTIIRNMISLNRFNEFLVTMAKSKSIDNINKLLLKKADIQDRNVKTIGNIELNRLRRTIYDSDNKRDKAIFELLSNTGIRVSELINLELEDVKITTRNGENNYSLIRIRQGKGKVYREVPLNSISRNSIKGYLDIRPSINSNKIFIGERGPLQRFSINKILRKYCRIAQIGEISPHVLRHTFATRLLVESNIDLVTIAKLLGHSNSQVTENYYINTTTKNKIDAVESLDF